MAWLLGGWALEGWAADDPTLAYSTYLGGADDDSVYGMTVDAEGNLYVTGSTSSPDFPLASAFQTSLRGRGDAFVTKFDRQGRIVYSTFLGGSGDEQGEDVAVDRRGHVYVVGYANSADFPRVGGLPASAAGGGGDTFVAELDPAGRLVFSTRLGGSAHDSGYGIGVDAGGRIYVAGYTNSTDFPVRNGLSSTLRGSGPGFASDGFVARLSPSGEEVEAATYLGGGGGEHVLDLHVDPEGHAYVLGRTDSRDFPLANPVVAAWPGSGISSSPSGFVTKLAPSLASLVYSTYFLSGRDLTADSSGNTYVIGLPGRPSPGGLCASKLSPTGAVLLEACFGGGSSGYEGALSIAVDRQGNIILAGITASTDFPLRDPIQSECAPMDFGLPCIPDIFVTKLDPSGTTILFSTYLGGTLPMPFGYPPDEAAEGVGVDARGDIYLAGWTYSADFPTAAAVQPEHGGGTDSGQIDAFATRIALGNPPPDCSAATASPAAVWPPNGKLVPVTIRGVTDPEGDRITLALTGIRQDEPLTKTGVPDASGLGTASALVRADRSGNGDGRVYHLSFTATDAAGGTCTGRVTVCVPHDQRRGACGDGGALIDSVQP